MLRTPTPIIGALYCMKTESQIHERVFSLASALADAATAENEKEYNRRYSELELLCAETNRAGAAHPFYYETLGDFTLDDEEALDIYEEALKLAEGVEHIESRVSILLAIAERYRELDDADAAVGYATEANKSINGVKNEALRQDLAEFLASMRNVI